nr:type 3 dihydrofolate reductase [Saliniradius amylolyticus]
MIAAMAKNRVIGRDNDMPWHQPADLKHFKQVTMGKPIIMGRKTFESIGRPLPGRTNVVISRSPDFNPEGVEVVTTPQQALERVQSQDEVMVIGGGRIYELFLPLAERLYITDIDLDVIGDTYFPDYQAEAGWIEVTSESFKADDKNACNMVFRTLDRQH